MPKHITRRRFVRSTTAVAIASPLITRNVLGANERLNIAAIGAGGKGAVDIGYCNGENVVALCDVDENRASASYRKFPKAKRYRDFRVMLEQQKDIDAVTVSTPDHTHAVAAMMAMQLSKHVYVQKPLTHCVHDARLLTETAHKMKLVTQMGNQGHSHNDSRRMVELVQGGALGDVREIHVWTDRPIWPQGIDRPTNKVAVPSHLDWDLWLGPAPDRPYHPAYVPFKWRGWWDFGTGSIGDMGCHNMDLAFWSMKLRDPVSVEATSSEVNNETAPSWSITTWTFPQRDGLPPCKLTWYDGRKKPDPALAKQKTLPGNGCIMIGSTDTLYVPMYWGAGKLVSGRPLSDHDNIAQSLPRHPDTDNDRHHHLEWIAACKGNGKALSDFDYAGPMTEAVLLGNLAVRSGKRIEWDAKQMKVTNVSEANQWVRDKTRNGW